MDDVEAMCDRVTILRKGEVVVSGEIRSLLRGDVLETDVVYRSTSPYGEPQLGKRGLYRAISAGAPRPEEVGARAIQWVLSLADGGHSLLDMADRSGVPFAALREAAGRSNTLVHTLDAEGAGSFADWMQTFGPDARVGREQHERAAVAWLEFHRDNRLGALGASRTGNPSDLNKTILFEAQEASVVWVAIVLMFGFKEEWRVGHCAHDHAARTCEPDVETFSPGLVKR